MDDLGTIFSPNNWPGHRPQSLEHPHSILALCPGALLPLPPWHILQVAFGQITGGMMQAFQLAPIVWTCTGFGAAPIDPCRDSV